MYKVYLKGDKIYFVTEVDGKDLVIRFFPNSDHAMRGKAIVCDGVELDDTQCQRIVPDEEVSIDVRVEAFTAEYGVDWLDELGELIEDSYESTMQVAVRVGAPLDNAELRIRKVSSYAPSVGSCIVISVYDIAYTDDEGSSVSDVVTVVSIEGDGDEDIYSAISIESIDGDFDGSFEELDIAAELEDDNEADLKDLDDEITDYFPDGDDSGLVDFDGI